MSSSSSLAPGEYQLPSPPLDPVSALSFSPDASPASSARLLVSSWDKSVRLYHLPAASSDDDSPASSQALQGQVHLVHTFEHDAAVLDVCWVNDKLAASAALDRRVRLLNLETGQSNILGKHDQAVSRIRYSKETNLLVSVSWDKTLKLWDPLSDPPRLLKTLQLPDKALALDVSPPFPHLSSVQCPPSSSSAEFHPLPVEDPTPRAVVAMAGRSVFIYDLSRFRKLVDDGKTEEEEGDDKEWEPEQRRESSLKFMIRDIRVMPGGHGFALSSVEGRIGVEFFDPSPEGQAKKYAFKCHRQVVEGVDTVYPVNSMAFHPGHGTFASLGGDATLSIWDPIAKKRIRQYPRYPSPLSAGAISADGTLLAVASGAENIEDTRHPGPGAGEVGDIGRGGEGNVRIHIRSVWEDCKPKAKAAPTA